MEANCDSPPRDVNLGRNVLDAHDAVRLVRSRGSKSTTAARDILEGPWKYRRRLELP